MKSVAIYARVSSERQAQDATVDSQVEALKQRVAKDGHQLLPEQCFVDDGFSGSSLYRPALEKLRDAVADGSIDELYVLAPDRLARNYAHQVLLLEEFKSRGLDVIFINRPAGNTPEDALLVQVQGMIAEYERAKIMERNRRGKLHRARKGSVNVLSGAPYGYLYVKKTDVHDAHYEVLEDEAAVVRKIYQWYTVEQHSMGQICRMLREDGVSTRTGLKRWDKTVVWGILRNPAYIGKACYGKTESVPRVLTNRAARKGTGMPRRLKSSSRQKPADQWIAVEVPPIISESRFEAAQEQLERNKKFSERNRKGGQYLLRGLLVCQRCSYSLYAKPLSAASTRGYTRHYAYYRCIGTDSYRFEDGPVCDNKQVRTDELDAAIWRTIIEVLNEPERVLREFGRRQKTDGFDLGLLKEQKDSLLKTRKKTEGSIQRLIDAYQAGALELEELKPRTLKLREKVRSLDEQIQQAEQAISGTLELTEVVTRLSEFKARMANGLDQMDFDERSKLVRLLIDRVEVNRDDVNVIYRIGAGHG